MGRLPPTPTRARFDVGDSLRALSALGVVALHAIALSVALTGYGDRLLKDPSQYYAALFGPLGHALNGLLVTVDVFFVLSGYLLARPFLRAYIDDERLPSIPGYLRNRALRVLPVLWVVLFAAVVIEGTRESSWWDVLGLATFLGDFQTSGGRLAIGQAWSLAMEVRFYLALPIAGIVLVGLKRLLGGRLSSGARIVFVLIALGIAYEASRRYAISHSRDVTVSFGSYVLFFVPGIALAVLEHVVPARIVGRRWAGRVAALIFTTGVALTLFAYSLTFHVPSPWDQYLVPAGVSAVVAGPLLWQWTGRSAWRTLDNPVLHWIGERSYPLFLVHGLVLVNLGPLLVSGGYKQTLLVLGPIGLALSLVCADLLHRFVERPALRRKRDYADGLRSPAELGELQRTSTA